MLRLEVQDSHRVDARAFCTHRVDGALKRMACIDLVAAKREDQLKVRNLLRPHEHLQEAEGRPVGPLHVIEEEHQRVLGPRKHPNERAEHDLEPILSFLRIERRAQAAADQR